MRLPAIIDDFSQGEVSPLMLARLSSSEVKRGVAKALNMLPDPRGPMIGRQGFGHVADIPATDLNATIFDFEMYEGKTLALVFYDNKLTIYNVSKSIVTIHTVTTPYTATLLHGASRDQHNLVGEKSPDGTKMYFLHKSVTPYSITIADLATPADDELTVTFGAVTFTGKPTEWTGDNYPTTMTFFQDRTWWAGCKDNPETFWGSKSGTENHHIMTLGTLADDAVKFVLQKEGLIKWLSGHSHLLIGSSWGEFIATGSAMVIEPGDVQVDPQSAYGSMAVDPEFIGDEVLYVSTDGRKLRAMWWRWIESGWTSIDLTYASEHLTKGLIKDIAYSRDPDSIVWVLTKDGKMLACSYRRKPDQEPAVGWAELEMGAGIGKVTAICSAEDSGRSALLVAAQVEVDGVDKLHLMRMAALDPHSDELIVLDNYVERTPVAKVIDNLDHLEGQVVSLVGDGAVLPMQTVVDGEITLENDYTNVVIGHAYTQRMTTLPYIVYDKQLAHPHKKWDKVWAYLLNSFKPLINGRRAATRYPGTPMGEGEEPFTGLVQVSGSGWDRMGQITIEQDIPRPLIVLGIYGEVTVEIV